MQNYLIAIVFVILKMDFLYLGTAKHILKIWKELEYIDKTTFRKIQEKANEFEVPCDVGKLPRKIESCFDGFTADEYKNWVLLFSIYSLTDLIPKVHLECFRKFVIACHYLCRRIISKNDIEIAHSFLRQFCIQFQNLYGNDRVTPNMHLHCHIKECIFDYGPVYSFWLFSFER